MLLVSASDITGLARRQDKQREVTSVSAHTGQWTGGGDADRTTNWRDTATVATRRSSRRRWAGYGMP
jgi:hypothetical protein